MSDFPQVYAQSSIIGNPGRPDARMVGLMQMIDDLKKQNKKLQQKYEETNEWWTKYVCKGPVCRGPGRFCDKCSCNFEAMYEYPIKGSEVYKFYRILKKKIKKIKYICRSHDRRCALGSVAEWKEEVRNPIMDVIEDWDKQYDEWVHKKH